MDEGAATRRKENERLNEQLLDLAQPFPASFISQVDKGSYKADYVPWTTIAQMLLVKLGPYSWHVDATYSPGGNQITIAGHLTVIIDDTEVTVGAIQSDEAVGNKSVNPEAAESRCLARAAAKLGLGLHLWTGDKYPYFLEKSLRSGDDLAEVLSN